MIQIDEQYFNQLLKDKYSMQLYIDRLSELILKKTRYAEIYNYVRCNEKYTTKVKMRNHEDSN